MKEAYPSVLGEIFTRMPWLSLEGVMVQKFVDGKYGLWIKMERENKDIFPFVVELREGERGKVSNAIFVKSEKDLDFLSQLPEEILGAYIFFLHFPDIRKMEADFVGTDEGFVLVDAKAYLFES